MTTKSYTAVANVWVEVLDTGGLVESPSVYDSMVYQGPESPATAVGFTAADVHIVTKARPLYLPKDQKLWAMSQHASGLVVVTS
jgi:hypothetical protein